MTLLIGANLKHYTIIAADTRTSWHHPFFGNSHKDGDYKIAMCNFGLITGSGYIDALEAVKKELLSKEINHTDEFLEVVKRLALPKIDELHKNNTLIKDNTCFLLSYINNDRQLRLALIHPKWNYQLGFYEDAIISMPSDSSDVESEKYRGDLIKKLIRFDNKENNNEEYGKSLFMNLYNNIRIIAQYFNEISQKSNYVSRDMDFAALLLSGTVVYGYGDSCQVMNGALQMSIIPAAHQTRYLTPDIFKEGKNIDEISGGSQRF
jgi:tetrahydromethanopterin S-methyltransferase subunit F